MKRIAGGLLVFINGENADKVCYALSTLYWWNSNYKVIMADSDVVADYSINNFANNLGQRLINGSILFLSNANNPETLDRINKSGILIDDEGWTVTININPKEETDDKGVLNDTLSHIIHGNVIENCTDIIDNILQHSTIIEDDEENYYFTRITKSGERNYY